MPPFQNYFCETKQRINSNYKIELTSWYLTCTFRKVNRGDEAWTTEELVDPIFELGKSKGFVKGPTMRMPTDDLVVTPMSSDCVLYLLNRMKIPVTQLFIFLFCLL